MSRKSPVGEGVLGKAAIALLMLCAVGLLLSACGGGGSSSSGSSTAESSEPAEETTEETTEESSGGTDFASLEKVVEEAEKGPQEFEGPTEPVKPKAGVKVALVVCGEVLRGCVRPAEEFESVAETIGWSTKTYDGQLTPTGQNGAVHQALATDPEVIITSGISPEVLASALQQAREQNVLVASIGQGVAPSPTGFAFDINTDFEPGANAMGSWIVTSSEGKAVLLPMEDNTFFAAKVIGENIKKPVEECETCTVEETVQFVSTELTGSLPARIVSLLHQSPEIDYIGVPYDPAAAAIAPAIKNAGLNSVTIVSAIGNEENLAEVKEEGIQKADVAYDNRYEAWMAMYQTARLLNKEPLWKTPGASNPTTLYSGNVPWILFTPESPPAKASDWFAESIPYNEEFETLFGVK